MCSNLSLYAGRYFSPQPFEEKPEVRSLSRSPSYAKEGGALSGQKAAFLVSSFKVVGIIGRGRVVRQGSKTWHALGVSKDDKFVVNVLGATGAAQLHPNQIFVVGFTNADLNGTTLERKHFTPFAAAF